LGSGFRPLEQFVDLLPLASGRVGTGVFVRPFCTDKCHGYPIAHRIHDGVEHAKIIGAGKRQFFPVEVNRKTDHLLFPGVASDSESTFFTS
jgi:hypothetical protein